MRKMKSIKAIFRRGQSQQVAVDQQNQDDLSRASSISNLNSEGKNKGAKPRKAPSRDRIDKVGEKKNDRKGVSRNNNKLESCDSQQDTLQDLEILQKQLAEMANEKSSLALQLGEQKGHLNILQNEIEKLKSFQDESNHQMDKLTEENTVLRNRLRDVAHSPLSDTEKQQLLFESHRHHSSAPASIATNLLEDNLGDVTACTTPEWDKHSSGNVSEISVACLQDKINQMQETHYSTNEELQATLQELTDLQRQLTELQQENDRLTDEKTLMFDSLCRQTERLNDTRDEVESLKQLLYKEKDEHNSGNFESAVEREKKLVDLLKSAQEERENLLLKLDQLQGELQETRVQNNDKESEIINLAERVKTLESTLDAKHAEHKQLDRELALAKDQCSSRHIEINRLKDLLENARTKIIELEQDRALSDKSELDELLDNARKEKDALESEVAHLKDQLARSKNESEKLKEQVSILQEECKVTRNNAKSTQSDLEYKCDKLQQEKNNLTEQMQQFQELINELQYQSQCQVEDKRQLSAVLSETQRNLSETENKHMELSAEIEEIKKLRKEETEDWEKFQDDLLTSVRVANDFKTEAQKDLQKFILENKVLRDKLRQLESQIDKIKGSSLDSLACNSLEMQRRKSSSKSKSSKEEMSSGAFMALEGKERKDLLSKLVKKRDKKARGRAKPVSVEESLLLKSLDDWHSRIDPKIPDERLTEEEKSVKRLKDIYQSEQLLYKPKAKKPKEQLAISKPLLDSVIANPKLEKIANDPTLPLIDSIIRESALDKTITHKRTKATTDMRRHSSVHITKRDSINSNIGKSKSLTDITFIFEPRIDTLLRTKSFENLLENSTINLYRQSSIRPEDSVSNPRCSEKLTIHDSYGELNNILDEIPLDKDFIQLTKEQQYALKLKDALDKSKTNLNKVKYKKFYDNLNNASQESLEDINPRQSIESNTETLSNASSYSSGNFDVISGQIRCSKKRPTGKIVSSSSSINFQKNGFEYTEINPEDYQENLNIVEYDVTSPLNRKFEDLSFENTEDIENEYLPHNTEEIEYENQEIHCYTEDDDFENEEIQTSPTQTLKRQNKYGVKAPVYVRNVYKKVVEEMKEKCGLNDEINHDEDEETQEEQPSTSFDDFFTAVRVDQFEEQVNNEEMSNLIEEKALKKTSKVLLQTNQDDIRVKNYEIRGKNEDNLQLKNEESPESQNEENASIITVDNQSKNEENSHSKNEEIEEKIDQIKGINLDEDEETQEEPSTSFDDFFIAVRFEEQFNDEETVINSNDDIAEEMSNLIEEKSLEKPTYTSKVLLQINQDDIRVKNDEIRGKNEDNLQLKNEEYPESQNDENAVDFKDDQSKNEENSHSKNEEIEERIYQNEETFLPKNRQSSKIVDLKSKIEESLHLKNEEIEEINEKTFKNESYIFGLQSKKPPSSKVEELIKRYSGLDKESIKSQHFVINAKSSEDTFDLNKEDIEEKLNSLTCEEKELVKKIRSREERPLSVINMDDVKVIEEMARRYPGLDDEAVKNEERGKSSEGLMCATNSWRRRLNKISLDSNLGYTPVFDSDSRGSSPYSSLKKVVFKDA
ncbi:unnamed protein product [Brassicogethes aeneus]|uniref:Uncharacterized protein n=1 Tax=Brassicogethes aeneus TaxID=1431903 RepID=A0A9P0AW11_BRAAE|nr:unnamed protein product [Brassicogethes aeneus]